MTKPLFTTKHYKAIAEVINQAIKEEQNIYAKDLIYKEYSLRRDGIERLKTLLEAVFASDNPKYSQYKFVKLWKQ